MIFDHIGFNVSDFAASKAFFVQALAPLGIEVIAEGEDWAMMGRNGKGQFWFGSFGALPGALDIAFIAGSRQQVRDFHVSALAAGGQDNGAPSIRPNYHENYYSAFVIGPDGHNVEAVCHAPEP